MDPRRGGIATVGITDHAQTQLGDIVFVEVPEVGRKAEQGEAVAVVESVKAASDVFAPRFRRGDRGQRRRSPPSPALVNEDAEGKAWFFKLKIADAAELDGLMDEAAYKEFVKQSS